MQYFRRHNRIRYIFKKYHSGCLDVFLVFEHAPVFEHIREACAARTPSGYPHLGFGRARPLTSELLLHLILEAFPELISQPFPEFIAELFTV